MRVTQVLLVVAMAVSPQAAWAATTVCDAVWTDPARSRAIPVRVRMPATSSSAPVVMFSHGLGGTLAAGTEWAEAWAEAGIATIHLQHTGSDDTLWKSAAAGGRLAALRAGASGEQLMARVADVRFVLDEMMRRKGETMTGGCDLAGLDFTRIAMAGHSFGAVTTQALAGQRFAQGRSMADARIKAAIAFSPSPSRQLPDDESFGAIRIPFLSVTGTADFVPMLDRTEAKDRLRPFAAMPVGHKYLLLLNGADHAIFNGHQLRRAALPGDARVKIQVRAASTIFLKAYLQGDPEALRELTQKAGLAGSMHHGDIWRTK